MEGTRRATGPHSGSGRCRGVSLMPLLLLDCGCPCYCCCCSCWIVVVLTIAVVAVDVADADADADADDIVVAANDDTPNDGTPNNVSGLRSPSEGRRIRRCCCCCFDCSDSELLADAVVVVVIALLLPVMIVVGSYNRCCVSNPSSLTSSPSSKLLETHPLSLSLQTSEGYHNILLQFRCQMRQRLPFLLRIYPVPGIYFWNCSIWEC